MNQIYQGGGIAQSAGQSIEQQMKQRAYAEMQEQSIMKAPCERPKQSPIEGALDRLAKMVECARQDLNELHARLAPVSQPAPIESDALTGGRTAATCTVEGRISEITDCVVAIGNDLRAARNGLCI